MPDNDPSLPSPRFGRGTTAPPASKHVSCPAPDGREIRLEEVPGGFRLSEWVKGEMAPRAPVLTLEVLQTLLSAARAERLAPAAELASVWRAIEEIPVRSSGTRAGSSRRQVGGRFEELRVEWVDAGAPAMRFSRWVKVPGRLFERRDAPPTFEIEHYVTAIKGATARLERPPADQGEEWDRIDPDGTLRRLRDDEPFDELD